MNKYKTIIGIIILLISSMVSAQEELNIYLQTAAENNAGLKARFNEYMAALEVAPQVRSLPDPQLAFAYFIQPVETRVGPQNARFSVSQMFPWFGTLAAKENVAIKLAEAKYEAFKGSKSKLFNKVRSNYYNLYFNKKAIDISIENIDILNTFRQLVYIKVLAGLTTVVDEYRIEMEIGDLENHLALLKDNQHALELMFNNLLNVEDNNPVIIPELLWTSDIIFSKQASLDTILKNNHQLLSLDFQSEALNYKQELAVRSGKPSFSIAMDYTLIGKGDSNLAGTDALIFPRIGITIPLYRNKYKAMVQEVIYLEAAKENEKLDRINILENLFENGWKEYLDADRRISLYMRQQNLSEKSLKLIETDYSSGNKNFEEILRMERKFLKYNLELEKARADKQAAISFISYLMAN